MPEILTDWVALLRHRALESPEVKAYTFLAEGTAESESLTFQELDRKARALGARLQQLAAPGERALLLFPAGLDFVSALLGCFYAGVVAVPAYPPRPRRADSRLRVIAEESRPRAVLTTAALLPRVQAQAAEIPSLAAVHWLVTDSLPDGSAEDWVAPRLTADSLAFLQYTSGSTADPKGVMVSHGNLLHNERLIREACGHSPATVFVGWLPLYHDMGLIGNVLQPLYLGGRCILMSPTAFLQSPIRWLSAISRYRATTSGGPNFAYDLCVQRVSAEQRSELDLSSWSVAFNGAEPVRADTLKRFADTFADCGFRPGAHFPCYGLAEATLFVSGARRGQAATTLAVDAQALARHEVAALPASTAGARTLVSCGPPAEGQRVLIVNPASQCRSAAGEVGEIWLAGPSVGRGYWNRPEQTAAVFHAMPQDVAPEGPFLRTGDLGFLADGELFVTGRLKDLIILRGQNHYPQDLELTAEGSHPAVAAGAAAAFSVEGDGEERVVVVLERRPRSREGVEAVALEVRRAVAEEHEVKVHTVVLVPTGAVPKTSSGKIRRAACRELFLGGGLEVLGVSVLDQALAAGEGEEVQAPLAAGGGELGRAELLAYLTSAAARAMRQAANEIDPRHPLTGLGLDSLAAVELRFAIEEELGAVLSLEALLDGASVEELAERILVDRVGASAPVVLAPEESGAVYPLSAMQRALWFEQRLAPESPAYNLPFAAQVKGEVEVAAFAAAFAALYARHPALRATVVWRGDEPAQRIGPTEGLSLATWDGSSWSPAELLARFAEEAHRPFDLERGPLFRVTLVRGPGKALAFLLNAHHLVFDGVSLWNLLAELGPLYRAALAEQPVPLPPLAAGYGDFVRRQGETLASPDGERLLDFWHQRALALPAALAPLFVRPMGAVPGATAGIPAGGSRGFRLDATLHAGLRAVARDAGTTLYTVVAAAYLVLLSRHCGRRTVRIGTAVTGRGRPEFQRLVGCLYNVVLLACEVPPDLSFAAFLGQLRGQVVAALEHQDLPSPVLAERLTQERGVGGPPLFEAQLILHQLPAHAGEATLRDDGSDGVSVALDGWVLETLAIPPRAARVPLELELLAAADGLVGQLRYSSAHFTEAAAIRIVEHWQALLRRIAADASLPVSSLADLPWEERESLLDHWSRAERDYPGTALIHELFAEQAARAPHSVAAVDDGRAVTFGELEQRAEQLKNFLTRAEL